MAYLSVLGGKRLNGEVCASGGKNAALPMLACALLTAEDVVIKGCPNISDVSDMLMILRTLGAQVKKEGDTVTVCARDIDTTCMPEELSHKIRSSIFLLGSMLARKKEACFYPPGGCEIGKRPIDQHLYALSVMGVDSQWDNGKLFCSTAELKGGIINLRFPSVGATENALLAASLSDGVTVINGAAREPEICCLCNMLRSMGARLNGEGTGCIVVEGVKKLHGTELVCLPDRIETCTFLTAAAAAGGSVTVKNTCPAYFPEVIAVLEKAGAKVKIYGSNVKVDMSERANAFDIITAPFPGFPTDMQAQMCALACTSKGTSHITETVFENRLKHIYEMQKAGVSIKKEDNSVFISGTNKLMPSDFYASDLRSGAALVILALCCQGKSNVYGTEYIDRGYEDIESKLQLLGADIRRIT